MSSKSIPDMSPPHQGIGRAPKRWKDLRRKSVIQSGSLFMPEISLTMASSMPFLGLKT